MRFRLRRRLPPGTPDPGADPNDHTPDQADDLFAPEVNVVGHLFAALQVVRQTGPNSHLRAQADSIANLTRLGLVIHVRDANNYSVLSLRGGIHLDTNYAAAHGKGVDDAPLYLSQTIAGAMTNVKPTDPALGFIQPLGSVIDANNLWWQVDGWEQP